MCLETKKEIKFGDLNNECFFIIVNVFKRTRFPKKVGNKKSQSRRDMWSLWREKACARAFVNSKGLDPSEHVLRLRARGPNIEILTPATRLEKL